MLGLSLLLSAWFLFTPPTARLTVEVTQIDKPKGKIHLALYREGQQFLKEKPMLGRVVAVNDKTVRIALPIEPGTYAVVLYQDLNGNGELDKKMFGIPKEPYGFSRNFKPVFSGPTFDDCKVEVKEGETTITINLL